MKNICRIVVAVALLGPLAAAWAIDADAPPLPAVETVLERLAEHSPKEEANDLAFKQRYHFTRSRETEVRNSKGELNKREVKTQVNKPTSDPGKPEAAAETQTNRRGKSGRKTDFAVDREFLARFQFTLVGRETIGGRPTLILDLRARSEESRRSTISKIGSSTKWPAGSGWTRRNRCSSKPTFI